MRLGLAAADGTPGRAYSAIRSFFVRPRLRRSVGRQFADELGAPACDVLSLDELDELMAGLELIAAAASAAGG